MIAEDGLSPDSSRNTPSFRRQRSVCTVTPRGSRLTDWENEKENRLSPSIIGGTPSSSKRSHNGSRHRVESSAKRQPNSYDRRESTSNRVRCSPISRHTLSYGDEYDEGTANAGSSVYGRCLSLPSTERIMYDIVVAINF